MSRFRYFVELSRYLLSSTIYVLACIITLTIILRSVHSGLNFLIWKTHVTQWLFPNTETSYNTLAASITKDEPALDLDNIVIFLGECLG